MEKPFVVCHMLTSLDGKIDGAFFAAPGTAPALKAYGSLREYYACTATLYGTTTMLGGYAAGKVGTLPKRTSLPKEDFPSQSEVQNYIVSLDPEGILAFDSPYSQRKGRAKAHIIEALTERVSGAYLSYLQSLGISYVFAGKDRIDCGTLLHKLKTLFAIDRLMVAGGGITNWYFAADGLIDELSIVVAPVADGGCESASIFENINGSTKTAAFSLQEAKTLDGNSLWLRYRKE